ncbi:unnamed protein product [Pleuronectes platessa]|uniref:Uncharacterized protein n=1 Tax=Pleuronectes platessa TaxID=8262 RepID=A0A9N7UNQ3_PLEPL|nr:unnamed protein product [Pleuronectes platessa]
MSQTETYAPVSPRSSCMLRLAEPSSPGSAVPRPSPGRAAVSLLNEKKMRASTQSRYPAMSPCSMFSATQRLVERQRCRSSVPLLPLCVSALTQRMRRVQLRHRRAQITRDVSPSERSQLLGASRGALPGGPPHERRVPLAGAVAEVIRDKVPTRVQSRRRRGPPTAPAGDTTPRSKRKKAPTPLTP